MQGIVKVNKGCVIRLPTWIKRETGLKEGDILLISIQDGKIVLTLQKPTDPIEELSSELGDIDEDEVFERGIKKARISWKF